MKIETCLLWEFGAQTCVRERCHLLWHDGGESQFYLNWKEGGMGWGASFPLIGWIKPLCNNEIPLLGRRVFLCLPKVSVNSSVSA